MALENYNDWMMPQDDAIQSGAYSIDGKLIADSDSAYYDAFIRDHLIRLKLHDEYYDQLRNGNVIPIWNLTPQERARLASADYMYSDPGIVASLRDPDEIGYYVTDLNTGWDANGNKIVLYKTPDGRYITSSYTLDLGDLGIEPEATASYIYRLNKNGDGYDLNFNIFLNQEFGDDKWPDNFYQYLDDEDKYCLGKYMRYKYDLLYPNGQLQFTRSIDDPVLQKGEKLFKLQLYRRLFLTPLVNSGSPVDGFTTMDGIAMLGGPYSTLYFANRTVLHASIGDTQGAISSGINTALSASTALKLLRSSLLSPEFKNAFAQLYGEDEFKNAFLYALNSDSKYIAADLLEKASTAAMIGDAGAETYNATGDMDLAIYASLTTGVFFGVPKVASAIKNSRSYALVKSIIGKLYENAKNYGALGLDKLTTELMSLLMFSHNKNVQNAVLYFSKLYRNTRLGIEEGINLVKEDWHNGLEQVRNGISGNDNLSPVYEVVGTDGRTYRVPATGFEPATHMDMNIDLGGWWGRTKRAFKAVVDAAKEEEEVPFEEKPIVLEEDMLEPNVSVLQNNTLGRDWVYNTNEDIPFVPYETERNVVYNGKSEALDGEIYFDSNGNAIPNYSDTVPNPNSALIDSSRQYDFSVDPQTKHADFYVTIDKLKNGSSIKNINVSRSCSFMDIGLVGNDATVSQGFIPYGDSILHIPQVENPTTAEQYIYNIFNLMLAESIEKNGKLHFYNGRDGSVGTGGLIIGDLKSRMKERKKYLEEYISLNEKNTDPEILAEVKKNLDELKLIDNSLTVLSDSKSEVVKQANDFRKNRSDLTDDLKVPTTKEAEDIYFSKSEKSAENKLVLNPAENTESAESAESAEPPVVEELNNTSENQSQELQLQGDGSLSNLPEELTSNLLSSNLIPTTPDEMEGMVKDNFLKFKDLLTDAKKKIEDDKKSGMKYYSSFSGEDDPRLEFFKLVAELQDKYTAGRIKIGIDDIYSNATLDYTSFRDEIFYEMCKLCLNIKDKKDLFLAYRLWLKTQRVNEENAKYTLLALREMPYLDVGSISGKTNTLKTDDGLPLSYLFENGEGLEDVIGHRLDGLFDPMSGDAPIGMRTKFANARRKAARAWYRNLYDKPSISKEKIDNNKSYAAAEWAIHNFGNFADFAFFTGSYILTNNILNDENGKFAVSPTRDYDNELVGMLNNAPDAWPRWLLSAVTSLTATLAFRRCIGRSRILGKIPTPKSYIGVMTYKQNVVSNCFDQVIKSLSKYNDKSHMNALLKSLYAINHPTLGTYVSRGVKHGFLTSSAILSLIGLGTANSIMWNDYFYGKNPNTNDSDSSLYLIKPDTTEMEKDIDLAKSIFGEDTIFTLKKDSSLNNLLVLEDANENIQLTHEEPLEPELLIQLLATSNINLLLKLNNPQKQKSLNSNNKNKASSSTKSSVRPSTRSTSSTNIGPSDGSLGD